MSRLARATILGAVALAAYTAFVIVAMTGPQAATVLITLCVTLTLSAGVGAWWAGRPEPQWWLINGTVDGDDLRGPYPTREAAELFANRDPRLSGYRAVRR